MKVVYVRNFKIKLAVIIAAFLTFAVLSAEWYFLSGGRITIHLANGIRLSFLRPSSFLAGTIYVNKSLEGSFAEAGCFKKRAPEKFSTYKSLTGNFSFHYPSAFIINEREFSGDEILCHVDFHDKKNVSHGFIQVWNLSIPLYKFLDKSKAVSQQNYKYLKLTYLTVDGVDGYYWDYVVLTANMGAFKGSEVFFEKKGLMYRISWFVPEKLWNGEKEKTFKQIVDSFKVH